MTAPDLPSPTPSADKDAALVQGMFDRVAPCYDLANTVLSLGQDRHWRRVATHAADPRPGEVVVDVASGTGALAVELASTGADVVALDFSWNMLATGAKRVRRPDPGRLLWCNGDANRLPFPDACADAVTIAFGLRNLPDPIAGLREFARITKTGGRLIVLEFSQPEREPFRGLYRRYLVGALPRIAGLVGSDPPAYRYLAESIQAWPSAGDVARLLTGSGWREVQWKRLTGGIVAVHRAWNA